MGTSPSSYIHVPPREKWEDLLKENVPIDCRHFRDTIEPNTIHLVFGSESFNSFVFTPPISAFQIR